MREINVPAQTVREKIRMLQEFMPAGEHTPGIVLVTVGRVDEDGNFTDAPQQTYEITGEHYNELVGPAPAWAPDKPNGTYRDDDLWHCIDILRAQATGEQK